jgi:thymidylate synthase
MSIVIQGANADEVYHDGLWKLKVCGKAEDSRNGEVLTIQELTELILHPPQSRVMYDVERDANPFFHLFEAIWMFAGRQDASWLHQFNRNYLNYAETDGRVHGAYGHRWRKCFGVDQIKETIEHLKEDLTSRRAVIGMWNAANDLGVNARDIPCNTHIYFRIINNKLNMTVCNRSNDFVWGMAGANIVHMTMLQELIALGVGIKLGHYTAISNNCHIYEPHWELLKTILDVNHVHPSTPLLRKEEHYTQFLQDAEDFCNHVLPEECVYRTGWFAGVARPMMKLWKYRNIMEANNIESEDWRVAACQWIDRRMR